MRWSRRFPDDEADPLLRGYLRRSCGKKRLFRCTLGTKLPYPFGGMPSRMAASADIKQWFLSR